MEFRILGPLDVLDGGQAVDVGGQKQRALLAILLLHGNEVVSVDRLIDDLWDEEPPDTAPKALQVYVSGLRKVLGRDRLETAAPGYRIRIQDDELDLGRFGRLTAEGRHKDALALWRGPPLTDFAYKRFAQPEIARLEELRLACLQERIEQDLAAGHAALTGELEALVRTHPRHERFRAQLMLALYRSGRQSEALDAYQDARRTLDELGLEPGEELKRLEQRILQHDPGLDAPSAPIEPTAPGPGKQIGPVRASRRLLISTGTAALLVAGAAAVLLVMLVGGTGEAPAIDVPANAVAAIDAQTHRLLAIVPIAGGPSRLEAAGGTTWVVSDDSGTVTKVPQHAPREPKLLGIGGFPSDLAVGEGAGWVVDGSSGLLRKVDPVYGTVKQVRIAAPNSVYDVSRESFDPTSVAAGAGSVWVTTGSHTIARIDPRTGKGTHTPDLGGAVNGVAVGPGGVWAISGAAATASRLDPGGHVLVRIPIVSKPGFESPYPLQVAAGDRYVWVLNGNTATVTKIDTEQRAVTATIPIGIEHGPVRLAAGDGAAWVASRDGTLSRIDAETDDVTITRIGRGLRDVAVGGGAVWVTTGSGLTSTSAAADVKGSVRALPTSFCSPIAYAGGGQPQYLIVSDLQLQGQGTTGVQLSQAIQYVLAQHRFRAGRYAVGYQSCDASVASTYGLSPEKCTANALAYVRNPSVIGVIGSFFSVCSRLQIPILNRAREGRLGMVGFSNTYVGLTRAGPGTEPGDPRRYYPTGVRNYVRVVAADDVQAAAAALLARELRLHRVYTLYGEFPGGIGTAAAFESAAAKLGIDTVDGGPLTDSTDSSALVAAIKRARPDAVYLGLFLDPSSAQLIKELRAGLGSRVRLLTPDGFSNFPQLVRLAGAAAEGMLVSVPVVPPAQLPASGRRFIQAFGKQVGQSPGAYAPLAAEAAEVLLDAIARSDGTRKSVAARLLETKIDNGILGDFSFDANGDTTAGAVTIYRITRGLPKVVKVFRPDPHLVR